MSLSVCSCGVGGAVPCAIEARAASSKFILDGHVGFDPDAVTLAQELARRGWPGDSCNALRSLERKYAAALEAAGCPVGADGELTLEGQSGDSRSR